MILNTLSQFMIQFDFEFDDNGNKRSLFIPGNAFNMKNKSNLYGKN